MAEKKVKNILSLQIDPVLFEKATEEEKAQQVTMRESVSFMRDAMHRLKKNRIAMISLWVIIVIALIAFIVPAFYPYTYTKQDVTAQNLGPLIRASRFFRTLWERIILAGTTRSV